MARHLFVIGAQRSGSTYLYNMLDAHPDIYMAKPVRPEPKYFLEPSNIGRGYDAYREKYFSGQENHSWFGEKSTSYIERQDVAQNISHMMPESQILVILRDPVERAISNYFFTREHGMESYDIEQALDMESERLREWRGAGVSVSPHAYVQRGKYIQYLDLWSKYFTESQMIVLVAERFIGSESSVAGLYRRLCIDDKVRPENISQRVNESSRDRGASEISNEFRDELAETFKPWSKELSDRYNLDLSCWKGMA